MTTQLEEIVRLTAKITVWPQEYVRMVRELREILDQAQNPVDAGGHSDGSMDQETWTAARDLANALELTGRAVERLDRATRTVALSLPVIRRGAFPKLLADDLVGVQPMTAPAEGLFEIRFKTPEDELAEFTSVAWSPELGNKLWDWAKGHVRASLRDGKWSLAWWEDAPPLSGCIPSVQTMPNTWVKNRPGLYPDPPEGTVMVTLGEAQGGSTQATVLCIPIEKEAEMRAKLIFPPLPPAGPEYGGG